MGEDYCSAMELELGKRLRELPGPVLVTGHTGFKGTWLTFLLHRLGVRVVGLSLPAIPNSLFERAGRAGAIPEIFTDIGQYGEVHDFIRRHRPSVVIHMAAQPLVIESYKMPRKTFETNVLGTVNVLGASFEIDSVEAVAVITTDKVYRNDNLGREFIESDPLEGKDPYSASKVGAESAIAAWQQISKVSEGPKVIALRAGNVIGGGDWAENRLMPDLIRGFVNEGRVVIRNPRSTRPWQHVLDPLRGYVMALESTLINGPISAMNFGPDSKSLPVSEVVEISRKAWPYLTEVETADSQGNEGMEAIELHLDSNFAKDLLGWQPMWDQSEAVVATVAWWDSVLNRSLSPEGACQSDIDFMLSKRLGLGNS